MTNEFDADTAVDAVGMGSYRSTVTDRWSVGERPNGGYLMAIGMRALTDALAHPDPLTVTAHFLRSPLPGPVDIEVEVVRVGRTVSTGQVRIHGDGRELLRMLATYGDLRAARGPTALDRKPPGLPDLDACVRVPSDGRLPDGTEVSIMRRFDLRMSPDSIGWAFGRPSPKAEVSAWVRFSDGREPDLLSLIQVVDAAAPAVLSTGVHGSVPTLELTAHFRAHPAPGWLRLFTRTRALVDGYLEEEAEVWDSEDQLVAQARQFARLAGAGEA